MYFYMINDIYCLFNYSTSESTINRLLVPFLLGGLRAILTDQNKLVVAVGGVTAVAAGIYTTRYLDDQSSRVSSKNRTLF